MQNNTGIYEQIQSCGKKKYYTTLTTKILDDFLNKLNKQNMFKRRKKSEVTLKSECDKCDCLQPCTSKDCFRQKYQVTVILGEKYYNTKLELFLFTIPNNDEVLVSETNKVSFVAEDTWYIQNLITKEGILEVSIIKQLQ